MERHLVAGEERLARCLVPLVPEEHHTLALPALSNFRFSHLASTACSEPRMLHELPLSVISGKKESGEAAGETISLIDSKFDCSRPQIQVDEKAGSSDEYGNSSLSLHVSDTYSFQRPVRFSMNNDKDY